MDDATAQPIPPGTLPVGIERKDASVVTQGLNPALMAFLARLGLVYLHLFGTPAIITSGVDAKHAVGSKHYKGDAVDLRTATLNGVQLATLLLVVKTLSGFFPVCFFDEGNLPGAPHLHIEIAG